MIEWLSERSGTPLSQITGDIGRRLGLYGAPSLSGVTVSEMGALSLSSLWRAARVLSESIGTMPCKLYKRTADGREEASGPLYDLVHDEVNPNLSAMEFFSQLVWWAVVWGNGYAEIVRVGADPVSLMPLPPWCVFPEGDGGYMVRLSDGTEYELESVDCVCIAGPKPEPGCEGYRLTRIARDSLGLSLGLEHFASSTFKNGLKLGGALTTPNKLSEEGRSNLQKSLELEWGGVYSAGKWAVLEQGLKAEPFNIDVEASKLVELRNQQMLSICQWCGIPPNFIFVYDRATWNNSADMTRNFLQFSLNPWLCKIESELNRKVIRSKELYAEFLRESIVQMDTKTQHEVWAIGIQNGFYEVNDIRKMLNLPPISNPQPPMPTQTMPGVMNNAQ